VGQDLMNKNFPVYIKQFLKYCISGGIGAIIDFLVFSVLVTFFQIQYLISNVFSFCIGTIVVCYMQKNWTFQYKSNKQIQLYSKYLLSIGIVFTINTLILIWGVEIINLGEVYAKLVQVILSSIIGYLIQKNFVFTKSDNID
jgi:putative flippase GtrA